ncbi:PcfJ domain-containing protein [Paenibacillus sp. NAIST15-1]|uniref:PcfJ domain-containing protein n=1 Tax=Paenibacillus sp. NAIST15-1 TaxID=1605994 RepID=UPI00086F560D|nr:PcfJ domain-containing protein [Paenibacillus sp. NAIST15-1]GAV13256.1 hypothetical protein PBN151_3190 [Paenibacillus sp. NAIST15-1]
MTKDDAKLDKFMAHFPQQISSEIVDYATNVVLLKSRYIFVKRVKGIQFGYCTHCKENFVTPEMLKHNDSTSCPKCNSECTVKASGISRKRLADFAFFMWYEKSTQNPKAIIARGMHVLRDYSGDYQEVETKYRCNHMYLFEPGNSELYEWAYGGWTKRKSIISQFETSMIRTACFISQENIKSAVSGTPFQYSTWERYFDRGYYAQTDMVKFFDLAARYPCIEYLTKLGMHGFITTKLDGGQTYGAVNWHGKSIEKVLRLTKAEAKEWLRLSYKGDAESLHSYQHFKKLGLGFSFDQARELSQFSRGAGRYNRERLQPLLKRGSLQRILRYFLKQLDAKRYSSASYVFSDWKDYLGECEELGMDLSSESVVFPNDLRVAHQKTMRSIKIKRDEAVNTRIKQLVKKLGSKYSFTHNGLFVRLAGSSIELFDEGEALSHCVGRYAELYSNGKTTLLVIRRESEPDTPFYTMEVNDGKVLQCRGLKNCSMTPEVKAFVERFIDEKLTKKKRIKAIQGVAV